METFIKVLLFCSALISFMLGVVAIKSFAKLNFESVLCFIVAGLFFVALLWILYLNHLKGRKLIVKLTPKKSE